MTEFFKTLFTGIKEGAIAAWYDLKWYICIMAIILVVYLLKIFHKVTQGN